MKKFEQVFEILNLPLLISRKVEWEINSSIFHTVSCIYSYLFAKTPINIQIAYPIQKVPLENVRALSQQMIWSLNKLPLAKKK